MNNVTILIFLFFISLLAGQLGAFTVWPGVVVYLHDFILAILALATLCCPRKPQKFAKPRLLRAIVVFIAVAAFSLLLNCGKFTPWELGAGGLYLVRWIFYAALYVVVLHTYTYKDVWLFGLFGVGIGLGILGLFQFFLYPDLRNLMYLGWDPHYYRLFSTLLDPNYTGILLVFTLLLGMALWKQKKFRWIIASGEGIAFISLLLTYSRSSYLALIGALVVIAALKKQWRILIGAAAFVGIIFVLPKTPGSTLSLFRTESSFARIGNWKHGVALIRNVPLFGYGFNTLRYVSDFGLDSSILFVGATTGLVGLLAYGYLIFDMIRIGKKHVWYIACLVALGIHSLFVNSAFYPWVMIWMSILTGVVERSTGDT